MLNMYIILGSFCCIFRENCVLFVIIYTLDLCLGIVVLCVLQDFRPFYLAFDHRRVYFDSPRMPLCFYARRARGEQKN